MAEYIKREALREILDGWRDAHADVDDVHGCGLLEDVICEVDAQTAADVAPVVHGLWEKEPSSFWRWTPSGAVAVARATYRCGLCACGTEKIYTHFAPKQTSRFCRLSWTQGHSFAVTARERMTGLNETERLADDSLLDAGYSRWHCVYRVLFQKHFDRRHPPVAETVLVGWKVRWMSTSRNAKWSIC